MWPFDSDSKDTDSSSQDTDNKLDENNDNPENIHKQIASLEKVLNEKTNENKDENKDDIVNITQVLDSLKQKLENFEKNTDLPKGEPKINIKIFGSETPNSKGFFINDVKIVPQNLDEVTSSNDQVKHFLTNLVGYIENNTLEDSDDQKKPIESFFHHANEEMLLQLFNSNAEKSDDTGNTVDTGNTGGGKKRKRRTRKRKQKNRGTRNKKH